jgi:MSHA pilin protein MshA
MRRIEGFTLIELVVVIAILAILAATALPRFIDLQTEARTAAIAGVAGALSSGSAINYAARIAGNAAAQTVTSCSTGNLQVLLQENALPNNFSVTSAAGATTQGTAFTCTITNSVGGTPATATIIAVS